MSFFDFDSSLPKDNAHNPRAPGFSSAPDPFAGFSQQQFEEDEANAIDFEDTYDRLGDGLDEADDALNADTFGASATANASHGPGKDFDFSGQTTQMENTAQEEQMLRQLRQPPRVQPEIKPQLQPRFQAQSEPKPARTGYEKYSKAGNIPELQASADIWGMSNTPQRSAPITQSRQQTPVAAQQHERIPSIATATRKMMSLDEVEAAMRAQSKGTSQPPASVPEPPQLQQQQQHPSPQQIMHRQQQSMNQPPITQNMPSSQMDSMYPRQQYPGHGQMHDQFYPSSASPANAMYQHSPRPSAQFQQPQQPPQILQRPSQSSQSHVGLQQMPSTQQPVPAGARHMQQQSQEQINLPFNEISQNAQMGGMQRQNMSYNGPMITHPEQLLHLSDEQRTLFMEEEAKRAKRNHKIHMLSKDNGLMTPQDKNFITRIQLQQLLTATGNVDEQGHEAALNEDFYYQVFSQIRGAPRQHPSQSQFAQTYLHQTGGRPGNRRYPRSGAPAADSHMRRMEQQVQRAVEAAKLKPKNRQLIIEGSLGKISFSNAKTPKPLLNIKRTDSSDMRPQSAIKVRTVNTAAGRKMVLRDIEAVYSILLQMEDHERRMPPQPKEESSADDIQAHMDWRTRIQKLNEALWSNLKVLEPIDPTSLVPHPFIAILSHAKGKKAIPRVFRQIDDQQRLTVLTMIVVHLDLLDVIRLASPASNDVPVPKAVLDEVELFSQAVMPSLFAYINEAPLSIIAGLVGLIVERATMSTVLRTKIGLNLLTILISRAELLKQGSHVEEDGDHWNKLFDKLFDILEPQLYRAFTTPINTGEDTYVWQFIAVMATGSSPEQQQRLVIAVKDRVMDSVMHARALPEEIGKPRLENVNLFMRAIDLDVDYLE